MRGKRRSEREGAAPRWTIGLLAIHRAESLCAVIPISWTTNSFTRCIS
jgi:hypothetical protein